MHKKRYNASYYRSQSCRIRSNIWPVSLMIEKADNLKLSVVLRQILEDPWNSVRDSTYIKKLHQIRKYMQSIYAN